MLTNMPTNPFVEKIFFTEENLYLFFYLSRVITVVEAAAVEHWRHFQLQRPQ